jgi:phage terminase large subunit-like protein
VILDEAMVIPEEMHGALMPTLSAMPNPQLWYTGSAVDQESMEHGVVFARLRERAIRGEATRLAYFGWSPPFEHPDEVSEASAADPDVWAQANPALGIRITLSMSRWRASRWTRGRSRSSGSASGTGRRPGPRARSST